MNLNISKNHAELLLEAVKLLRQQEHDSHPDRSCPTDTEQHCMYLTSALRLAMKQPEDSHRPLVVMSCDEGNPDPTILSEIPLQVVLLDRDFTDPDYIGDQYGYAAIHHCIQDALHPYDRASRAVRSSYDGTAVVALELENYMNGLKDCRKEVRQRLRCEPVEVRQRYAEALKDMRTMRQQLSNREV